MRHTLLLTVVFALCAASPLAAQESKKQSTDKPVKTKRLPIVSESSLKMMRYVPRSVDVHTLSRAASNLFGRSFNVSMDRVNSRGPVKNILTIGDALVIYDTEEQVAKIMAGLAELESAGGSNQAVEKIEVLEYAPSHVSVSGLEQAIGAFVGRSRSSRSRAHVSAIHELNRIVVRGPESRVNDIRKFIAKLDVPRPQVTVTCWIVQGSTVAQEGRTLPLPRDLLGNLEKLVALPHFNTLGMGLVRTSVEARRTIEMNIGLENFGMADIRLIPESFDSATGTLYFGDCKCSVKDKSGMTQTFNTRASVAGGTYTVLGALGSKPIFVVLRISSAGQ